MSGELSVGDRLRPRSRVGRFMRAGAALLVVLVAVAVMVRLGIWQWDRGLRRGSLLNYSYGIEWFIFALLSVVGVIRLHWEGAAGPDEQPPRPELSSDAPLVGPPLEPGQPLEEITWVRIRRRLGLDPEGAGSRAPGSSVTGHDRSAEHPSRAGRGV